MEDYEKIRLELRAIIAEHKAKISENHYQSLCLEREMDLLQQRLRLLTPPNGDGDQNIQTKGDKNE